MSLTTATAGWQLGRLDAAALDQQRNGIAQQLSGVETGLQAAATIGVDQTDLSPIDRQAAALRRQQRTASPPALRRIGARAAALQAQVVSLQRAQLAENAAVEQAALVLGQRYAGRLEAMRVAGLSALAIGRNDATVAAFLQLQIGRTAGLMERYAAFIGSADPNQLALGVAGVQRYSPLVHNALVAQLPAQVIVVSIAGQRLQAFDHGSLVQESLVTTGRPALSTDIGRMQVTRKSSPWTMQSPWPKNSPYWYPDTKVAMVLWFTNTGEGIHDADWEPASAYGPGSTAGPYASHGCIHTPVDVMSYLFGWAQVGTPVVVIPGDGATAAAQTAQVTVDSQGRPLGSQPSGV
ncbi:MAG: L,D-transpeptidase [Candidatus Dormibacteraeota bacterium]|nr:L,D-transpeptidase [Candidatus Dormibacteraeota bacterium]